MSRFEAVFGQWVVKHRWWIIGVTALVVLAASSGMRFLTVNNNTRVFFSEDNPHSPFIIQSFIFLFFVIDFHAAIFVSPFISMAEAVVNAQANFRPLAVNI